MRQIYLWMCLLQIGVAVLAAENASCGAERTLSLTELAQKCYEATVAEYRA